MNQPLPEAKVVAAGERSYAWILPLVALAFAALLGHRAWSQRGPKITVHAAEGHGLAEGDPLLYRGIVVGRVETLALAPALDEVVVEVRLDPRARDVARAGSRFWVVRPHLSLDSVQGLETVVGARYLAVLPGPADGAGQDEFVALEEPPVPEVTAPGGLELFLEASTRFGLAPGAPLTYRRIEVGRVLSLGLASDATAVEVRAYVRPAYAQLVRDNTRFWETGGVEVRLGWRGGLKLDLESLRSLLVGGIAFATPPDAGAPVRTGQRFELHAEPEEDWLEWRPSLPVGTALLPADAVVPRPLRAHLAWTAGRLIDRSRGRQGWVLATAEGYLGPRDLLVADEDAHEGSSLLEVGGRSVALDGDPAWSEGGLALRVVPREEGREGWPIERVRTALEPEDCLVLADPGAPPRALSSGRLAGPGGSTGFRVDGAVAFDGDWHGAAVVARRDGALLGLLLVEDDGARISPFVPR